MSKKLSKKIYWLNLILSIMIVSYHAYNIPVYKNILNATNIGVIWIYIENYVSGIERVAVPLFFCMSGFLYYHNYTPDKAIYKIKSRIKSLLIPYFLWNFISWLCYFFVTHIPFIASKINMTMDLSFKGILYEICMGKYNALWFVRVLFFLALISPIVFYLINRKNKALFFVSVLISLEIIIGHSDTSFLFGACFYYIGASLALNNTKMVITDLKHPKICLIIFLVIEAVLASSLSSFQPRKHFLLILMSVILFWYGSDTFIALLPEKENAFWMTKYSFFIYCSHGFILESIEKILLIILGNTLIGAIIDYMAAPVLTVICICALAYFLKRNLKPIWVILNGGRV